MTLLSVKDLSHSFGGLKALNGLNFKVHSGMIKAVIGPNGAGKTTLFNIISGVIQPDRAHIEFDQHSITGLRPYRIAQRGLSRTFQNLSCFGSMTVLENVMIGCHCRTRCGMASSILRLPRQHREEHRIRDTAIKHLTFVGMEHLAERPVSALPFGQRRMVELARALATEPKLLLLDEPASGLNTSETDNLGKLITRIREQGISILLVEHDMSLVMEISDEILVLDFGTPIAEGSPATISNNPDVISIYLGGSFEDAED